MGSNGEDLEGYAGAGLYDRSVSEILFLDWRNGYKLLHLFNPLRPGVSKVETTELASQEYPQPGHGEIHQSVMLSTLLVIKYMSG